MIYHFTAPEMIQKGTGWMARLQGVFGVGWCGVDLFFVLSGFLITGILLDAKGSPTYFKSFYVRRVLRIFPIYYGVLLLVAIGRHIPAIADLFELNGRNGITSSLAWMFACVSNFVMAYRHSKTAFGPMGHFWSLAVEEHFYMVWPTLVFLCTRKQLAIACSGFVVGAFALRCGLAAHNHTTYATYLITPCRVDGLALGGLLALMVRSNLDVKKIRNLAWIVGIFCGIAVIGLGLRGGNSGGFSHYGRAMTTLGFSLFAFFFASVMALALSSSPGSLGRTILEWPPLRSVGRYSFAMYIFHLLFLAIFEVVQHPGNSPPSSTSQRISTELFLPSST